ncbi:alcohol dehydrogenase catalytic domain-containing protein [Agromyces sp. MMS24-K17]|uniref:alcohol dehydrogenase catalytic domain-containing protein n=1 Tax=Agromyces sp. MMS24-K17 TaxID=3372850 RepID=UPI0037553543
MASDVAVVVRAPGAAPQLEEVTVAEPRAGEVLVRILASGVCHTDLVAIDADAGYPLPAVFGHEGAGVVEAVGPDVSRLRPGDRVVLGFDSCGACRACRDGHPAYCDRFGALNRAPVRDALAVAATGEPLTTGWMAQSAWATRVLARESNAVAVEADVPPSVAAPLGCGVLTGAGTVLNVLRPGPDDALLVLGAGAVGLSAVMAAVATGCGRVVVSDPLEARRTLALELGATAAVAPEELADLLRRAGPVSRVLDTVGSQAAIDQALAALAPRGVCATVALRPGANRVEVAQGRLLWGRTLTGVIEGDAVLARDIPRLVALWRAGLLPVERLVTEYPFDEVDRAVADARAGHVVKAVLVAPGLESALRASSTSGGSALLTLLRTRTLDDDALAALWRSLPPVEPSDLRGLWTGWAVTTGHRAERLLDRLGWVGKRFRSDDDVDPIVCRTADGALVADTSFARGGASLWTVERDGVRTAAMVYDGLPIVDCFTRISPDAVLGVMHGRDARDDGRLFHFVLERASEPGA